jgi:hypothetical protein
MGYYKKELMNVRELIWSALEEGHRSHSAVFAYVRERHRRVSRAAVDELYDEIWNSDEAAEAFIWY